MKKEFYLIVSAMIIGFTAFALQPQASDSLSIIPREKKNTPIITTRVHTMGLFMYMGKVVNHNPAADLFFTYSTRSGWGVSAFKVVDLNDVHSHNNFAFAFLHKAFHVGKQLSITPWVGAALEQQQSFASHGSDIMLQLVTSFRVKNFTLEHIAMFNNMVFETAYQDWTNRARVIYSRGHVDISGFFWHNNGVFDQASYTSSGVSIFYNRIPVANRIYLGAGLTTLSTFQSSNLEKIPTQTGMQFSTTLTFK